MNIQELFSLEGRVALVTGGSRGIGRMIVEGFLAAGCAKVYISARKVGEVDATVAEFGEKVIGLPGDLSTLEGIQSLADQIAQREVKLDILVNNAGAAWGQDFEDFTEEGWDRTMNINVKTPFFLTQKLYPLLKASASEAQPAKVINISSVDGQRINPWETYPYQASKAAVIHLTRRMAARLVRDNIFVSSISPGAFPTQMNRAARDREDAAAAGIPAGRIGRTEDMAAGAVYLASRAGDYVIGETLTIDGGIVNAHLPSHFAEA